MTLFIRPKLLRPLETTEPEAEVVSPEWGTSGAPTIEQLASGLDELGRLLIELKVEGQQITARSIVNDVEARRFLVLAKRGQGARSVSQTSLVWSGYVEAVLSAYRFQVRAALAHASAVTRALFPGGDSTPMNRLVRALEKATWNETSGQEGLLQLWTQALAARAIGDAHPELRADLEELLVQRVLSESGRPAAVMDEARRQRG